MKQSFLSYYLLCERHNNVSYSVNHNVALIIKSIAKHFRDNLADELAEICEDLRTDYDYLFAGLYYLKVVAEENKRNVQLVFRRNIDFKVKSFVQKVKVTILLVDENDGVHGMFDYNNGDVPEINIQLEMRDIPDSDEHSIQYAFIRKFQIYLSHELMHCYQYLSKNNFIERENTEASEAIPNSFSYIVYFLSHNEIESNLMSAWSQYKNGRKKGMTFCNQILRILDFYISDKETGADKNHYTPQYLHQKYIEADDLNDLFCLDYILGVYIPQSRYYNACKQDENYVKYLSTLNANDLKERLKTLEEIYNFLEEKFSDKNYHHIPQAFYAISNKESLNKLCTSTEYTQSIKSKIANDDFADDDNVYDEEEDTIVYGRPDLDH